MMFETKYSNTDSGISENRQNDEPVPLRPVDLTNLDPKTLWSRIKAKSIERSMPMVLAILRHVKPVLSIGDFTIVTREENVRAALNDHEAFTVPYESEMCDLTGDENFALGDDGELHERQRSALNVAFQNIDIKATREHVRQCSMAIISDQPGTVDLFSDLLPQVTTRTSERLMDFTIHDHKAFSDATVAMSLLLFADPFGSKETRLEARIGARTLKPVVDATVDRAMMNESSGILADMVAELKNLGTDEAQIKRDIEAAGYGLSVGFAATHRFVGGIMESLIERPKQWERAKTLALKIATGREEGSANSDADLEAFEKLMMEASRFHPSIYPGSFRIRSDKSMEQSDKHPALQAIKAGQTVLVAAGSALRHQSTCSGATACPGAGKFEPDRFHSDKLHRELHFGDGHHWCVGAHVALAIAGETLIALLSQPKIGFGKRRAKVKMVAAVPHSLPFRFKPTVGAMKQTQIIAAIPLLESSSKDGLMARLKELLDEGAIAEAFHQSNIVHFASLNCVDLGKKNKESPHLLVELNIDGELFDGLTVIENSIDAIPAARAAIEELCQQLGDKELMAGLLTNDLLAAFFNSVQRNTANLTRNPWGDTGVHFAGTSEFSVYQIAREQELAKVVDDYLTSMAHDDIATARGLNDRIKQQDKTDAQKILDLSEHSTLLFEKTRKHITERGFGDLLVRSPSRGPAFARDARRNYSEFWRRYFSGLVYKVPAFLFVLATVLLFFSTFYWGWKKLNVYVTFWMSPVLVFVTLAIAFVIWLRRQEKREKPNERRVDIETLRRIRQLEEKPDCAQSHVTTVSRFKTTLFRRMTFAVAMHIIGAFAKLWFRPGFLTDFATIHYARWVRFRGTDQLIFQSNYDGSWESYLEDFTSKVHAGQTLAWNNAEGFPKTEWLIEKGAHDGDRFKRWVRNQQVEVPFWYSRFPNLTIPQIQANSLIRDGLARAKDVADHRAWLKLFGSLPTKGGELESDQVQSLVFRGHGGHEAAACVPLIFNDPQRARDWIAKLIADAEDTKSPGHLYLRRLSAGGWTAAQREVLHPQLSFGDGVPRRAALFLALSAGGLAKLGLEREDQTGLNAFPGPFLDGMRERAAVLDDPFNIGWSDSGWLPSQAGSGANSHSPREVAAINGDQRYGTEFAADAALLIYIKEPATEIDTKDVAPSVEDNDAFAHVREELEKELSSHRIRASETIDLSRSRTRSASLGGFGFHEGASQPVMRGTHAAAKHKGRDTEVLEPGEFLLGYPDQRGYVPPEILVRPDRAAFDTLPLAGPMRPDAHPNFDDPERSSAFDFGRNGSFLVIRQLEHNQSIVKNSTAPLNCPQYIETFTHSVSQWASKMARDIYSGIEKQEKPIENLAHLEPPTKWQSISSHRTSLTHGTSTNDDSNMEMEPQPFLEELIAAKLFGRWKDGSSLVRHPLMSATAQLRERTLAEVFSGRNGDAVHNLWKETGAHSDDEHHAFAVGDRLLWDDNAWDAFVKSATCTLTGAGSEMLPKWLILSDEWPTMVDNDFNFSHDDPQGLSCPIGSHIRRTNPRDTPNPDNPNQKAINNRHRLLRRGRPYRRLDDSAQIVGTHFMCLNANIERQFEFVQRTWMNSPSFQGLNRQPDPIASPHYPKDRFVIPHTGSLTDLRYHRTETDELQKRNAGARSRDGDVNQFVTLVGGGYFFLPSRAALSYLAHPRRSFSKNQKRDHDAYQN